MTKLGKNNQKRLAKLVAAALMCAGGGFFSLPSVATAAEATVTGVTGSSGTYTATCAPLNSVECIKPDTTDYCFPTAGYDVLNIEGTFNTGDLGFLGGYSPIAGVSGKTVNIKDNGTNLTANMIYGGLHTSGSSVSVEGNTVNVASGTIFTTIIGGAWGGSPSGNHVNITGGTINYGGYSCQIFGGGSAVGDAENNTVTISSGEINQIAAPMIPPMIAGGVTRADGKNAKGNVVTIGGDASLTGMPNLTVLGGQSDSGAANDNTVTISGDANLPATTLICGGFAPSGEAKNNIVTISGGTLGNGTAYIYGGMAPSGEAKNNTVNILTAINVAHIMGGEGTIATGNTLNVNAIGVTVGDDGVDGFQNMNFFLPDGAAGKTMLTVNAKDAYGDGKATDLSGVAIGAAVQPGATFAKGDTVNLITNPSGLTTDGTTTMKQITDETVTIQTKPTAKTLTTDQSYELELAKTADETTIVATVKDVKETPSGGGGDEPSGGATNDGLKSPVETRAAVTTFVNAGADMLASQGFAQAANAVALDMAESAKTGAGAPNVGGFTPFAAFGGSSMRAESGSHVDTKGFGLNIGFARELPNSQGKLLFGPVVEYGGGKYDSYNNDVHGEGGAHYFGVGLMARQVNYDGFYYEGSVRGGRVTSDYKSFDVRPGNKVEYDSSSNYWAAHLGVGKVFAAGKQGTVDGYLKYFYSHQGGDDTDIKFDGDPRERASFDSVDSNRIRIGARYTHKINEMNSLYGGLAYQYEFGGEARAHYSTSGVAPSPSVKGSSGMLELGWQVKPGEGPLTLDLGVTGWAGKQRGGSVQLGATWSF